MELIKKIRKSEDEVASGKVVKANTEMSDEEIDELLITQKRLKEKESGKDVTQSKEEFLKDLETW